MKRTTVVNGCTLVKSRSEWHLQMSFASVVCSFGEAREPFGSKQSWRPQIKKAMETCRPSVFRRLHERSWGLCHIGGTAFLCGAKTVSRCACAASVRTKKRLMVHQKNTNAAACEHDNP